MLIDSHCHIHEASYALDREDALRRAHAAGVHKIICVGTDATSSWQAVEFASRHDNVYSAIGVHPHESAGGWTQICQLESPKIVAVGEIGLDYFYTHSPRQDQIDALEGQLQLARERKLPVIFHVREAFDDFWPIFDNFTGINGVLHSFTDTMHNLDEALRRGLYVGVNGISVFTKDTAQKVTFAAIPLDRLIMETDAPFLTPPPFRGKVNEPAFVKYVAEHHAAVRKITADEIANTTSANATALFAL